MRRNYKNALDCVLQLAGVGGQTLERSHGIYCPSSNTQLVSVGDFQPGKQGSYLQWLFPEQMLSDNIFWQYVLAFAVTASMPFDVVKSRLMSQRARDASLRQTKARNYSGIIDCFQQSVKDDGVRVLFKGWIPAYVKLAPYTVLSFFFVERITQAAFGREAL